jgi:hypothetical protein
MTILTCSLFSAVSLVFALVACSPPGAGPALADAHAPGWTGRTIVSGNNSTVAGDAQATGWAQRWAIGRQR